jgi:DNA-directed RNA polymerase subunit RPC12/RpoP
MVCYKCEKCNKEFNKKSNYIKHINKKKPCIVDENNENNVNNVNTDKINTIIYKCGKCNKEFNKKSNYTYHINKKNPCNSKLLINEKIKLLDIIKELEKQNSNLENKNKNLKEKTNVLRENICTLKIQMLEKEKLLNNNKNNDEDIKIKMVQEYVYIIRECDFVRLNEEIYKIGRTAKTNPEDRFQKYRKGTEIVAFFKVNNSIECENKMIKCFSNHINIKKRSEYGKEYFEGNRKELLNEIVQIVNNYNN